ncbi:MAG: hypothetical protein COA94_03825 [Rickettsiales bacterium]|nr:MAG: hypothetical protein COA94_03825 [Rickettsiales bacterium]
MSKIFKLFSTIVGYRLSLKELYFSLTTWLAGLVAFLGMATKFDSSLLLANIVIAFCVLGMIVLITNRVLLSCFLTLLLAVLFDYVKLIKWQFFMQELLAADVFMLKLLINHGLLRVIYEYSTKEIYLIFFLLLINFMLMWNRSDTLLKKKELGNKHYYIFRLISFALAALISLKMFDLAIDKKSYVHSAIESMKSTQKDYQRRTYGPFADVLFTLQDVYITPNHGEVDEALILDEVKKNNFARSDKLSEMPDIVVILNESVFDPTKLDYDFAEKFDFSFFKDTKNTKYSGILNVNTFGGSSWISEYEINTGVPHKSFSGPSYMPFITLVPATNNSIMSHLRSIGYRVEVVYPVDKNFSLAFDAYTKLGAHEISDIYEFGFKPKSWGNIPDTMIGDMIIDALDRNPGKPKYIYASTMLNHGPHSGFFPDTIGCSRVMHDGLCSKLNDYVSRLNRTSVDQSALIEKLMKRKKKTIIVNFGDHMPSFEGHSTHLRFKREIKDYYKTFYNINANFKIASREKYPSLDISFIPSLVLDMAKVNSNDFYKASSLVRKKCKGQMSSCASEKDMLLESYKSLTVKQLDF